MFKTGEIRLDHSGSNTSDLRCPRCGSEYLHHVGATFYDRTEDGKDEVKIEVTGSQVNTAMVSAATSENPSARRHGMLIHFQCEECSRHGGRIALGIAQHKGCTEISWNFDPLPA